MSSQTGNTPPNSGPQQQQQGVNIPTPKTINDIKDFHDLSRVNSTSRSQVMAHPGGFEVHEDLILQQKAKDAVSKASTSLTGLSTKTTQAKFDSLAEYEDKIAGAAEGPHKKFLEEQRDKLKKQLTKDGEGILRDHGKAAEHVAQAQAAIAEDVERLTKEADKVYNAERKRLTNIKPTDEAHAKAIEKELEEMSKVHAAKLEAISKKGAELSEQFAEKTENAAKLMSDVEKHTGLKSGDFMSSKAKGALTSKGGTMSEAAYKDLSVVEKMTKSAGANWNARSGGGKAMTVVGGVVGAGAFIDGLRKIIAPKRNEQGERDGSLFGAVGEAGAGALITYLSVIHGGKNKLIGGR